MGFLRIVELVMFGCLSTAEAGLGNHLTEALEDSRGSTGRQLSQVNHNRISISSLGYQV